MSDVKAMSGREEDAKPTSLSERGKPKEVRALDKLSNQALQSLLEYATRPQPTQPPGAREGKTLDELDASFANEVLKKLPKIVSRVSTLEALDLPATVPSNVARYFSETHRCYLYGFPVACAVLCRAILESALAERIDPDSVIKRRKKSDESYIQLLVKEAERLRVLTDDRPECAIAVRDAGNEAIHDYVEFEKRMGDPLRGIAYIVDSTRKVLIDLYSAGSVGG